MLRSVVLSAIACLLVMPLVSLADDIPANAMEAYEHVQAARQEAAEIAKDGTPAGLQNAAALLEGALSYLGREDVSERATGNMYLYARGHDVRMDLATIYSRMGDKERAISMLEAMQTFFWISGVGELLAKDDAFANIRDDPRFKQLLAVEALSDRIWKGRAIATPYKEVLSVEERVAGLSLFWAEVRQGFVHFDHVPELDWDRVYVDYLPKVMEAKSTSEYYRVMMQLAPLLNDGHTNIYPPKELRQHFYSRPPVTVGMVEDKVLVKSVQSVSLAKQLHAGEEVVAIGGVAVKQYAADHVAPFVSSSTPQDRMLRTFSYQLLSGDAEEPIKLHLRDAAGRERDELVARSGYMDSIREAPFQFRILPGNVAYVALDHFESDQGVKAFEAALPSILKARALVIDVRSNGGGSTQYGLKILSYLSRSPIAGSTSFERVETSLDRAQGANWVRWRPVPDSGEAFKLPHERIFEGPVAVLIGAQTFSAAEDFVVAFESMKRGITVGEPTGGSTGQPLEFALPGGGIARVCVKRDAYPDGREFVGKGIRPTFEVKPTVADIRAGRDPVLKLGADKLSQNR